MKLIDLTLQLENLEGGFFDTTFQAYIQFLFLDDEIFNFTGHHIEMICQLSPLIIAVVDGDAFGLFSHPEVVNRVNNPAKRSPDEKTVTGTCNEHDYGEKSQRAEKKHHFCVGEDFLIRV
ncbi:MAG: hypothetical protein A4E66_02547 [Syntrophus sp. PtaB.Bin001]|nr:MAG: hypothetical protein A4E66_02547 [Syntrophus sp. PtaB.Bin001]